MDSESVEVFIVPKKSLASASLFSLSLMIALLTYCQAASAADAETPSSGKVALALGGGGARGAAHLGVLKVFEQEGLKPDMIVGTSMGSVVGSLYCAGVSLEEIERLLSNGTIKKAFMPVPVPLQIFGKTLQGLAFWRSSKLPGLYSGEALERFVDKTVGPGNQNIEDLKIRFAAVAVDLIDGQAYRLEKGELGKAVRASSSFPPILKPVKIGEHVYSDGGIRSNLPTFSAKDMGADAVIAVNVDEELTKVRPSDPKGYTKLINRVSSIIISVRDELHNNQGDVVLFPEVGGISVFSVDTDDYSKAIKAGENAARKSLPEIKRLFAVQKQLSQAAKPTI
ncbi:MAG: patatin-like phospholipase family protein [Candidatus Obscuribacterales bacterium]|nr:patatin-like phospholipase family protein [Candidatus Obscuribacterales bacterium]